MAKKAKPTGVYRGRLMADGYGNLLAEDGEFQGHPVAFDDGQYVFIDPSEPSHNERHHQNALEVVATQDQDETLPGYAGDQSKPVKGAEHHWGPVSDDPHFDEKQGTIRLKFHSDSIAPQVTGHTDAYEGAEDDD